VEKHFNDPRLWIDRGRRLGELKRWDEAAKAFDKAAELAPKNPQVWKERGRAYADLGMWDEAAADFVKALELAGAAGNVQGQVVRLEEVFPRVAKLRPTDRQLWIERLTYVGRSARWPDTDKAIVKVTELDPADHLNWHIRATARIQVGDLEGYRADCREMLDRFGKSTDGLIAQRIAKACLLAPGGVDDPAAVVNILQQATKPADIANWRAATLALGHYRTGRYDQATKELALFSRATGFLEAMALAVRAMVQFKNDRMDAARQSLADARQVMTHFAKPGPGELQDNWHNWLQADLLLREAEALIPTVPARPRWIRPAKHAAWRPNC
jgi:tetratricopeptide (TPR) repeat protein